jgi:hypothetical protein
MQPRTSGFGPSARFGHTISLTSEGKLFIFGGCSLENSSGIPKYHSDVRLLDTETMNWTRPRIDGFTPTGRQGHSAVLMKEDKIVIFGGWGKGGCQTNEMIANPNAYSIHILDTRAMCWWLPRKCNKKPVRHLYQHGACASDSSLLLFGGFDGRQAAGDFIVINMDFGENG